MRAVFFSTPEGDNHNQLFATALRTIFLIADEVIVAGEYAGRMHADELLKKQTLMQKVATLELSARLMGRKDVIQAIERSKPSLQNSVNARYRDNKIFVLAKQLENSFNKMYITLFPYYEELNKDSNLHHIIPLVNEKLLHTALLEYSSTGGAFIPKNAVTTAKKLIELVFPATNNRRPSLACFPLEYRNIIKSGEKDAAELTRREKEKISEGERLVEQMNYCFAIPSYSHLVGTEIKLLKQGMKPVFAPFCEKVEALIDVIITNKENEELPRQFLREEILTIRESIQTAVEENELLMFSEKEGFAAVELTPLLFIGLLPIEDLWKMYWVREAIDDATLQQLIKTTKDRKQFPAICPVATFMLYNSEFDKYSDEHEKTTNGVTKKKSISLDDDDL